MNTSEFHLEIAVAYLSFITATVLQFFALLFLTLVRSGLNLRTGSRTTLKWNEPVTTT